MSQQEAANNNSTMMPALFMLATAAAATTTTTTNETTRTEFNDDNNNNQIQQQLDVQQVLLVGLLISLILISIVGNCLVCVAIFTDRRLRKLGNAFIVSLAIADLFVSCLVMTFALCNDLMNQWIFGDWFCDVWISFDIMCCTASILNLCAISLDRFIHIKDCLLYNQWMTRKVAISAVIIIWFISALVSFVPINLGWHKPPTGHHGAGNDHHHHHQQQQPINESSSPSLSSSYSSSSYLAGARLAALEMTKQQQQQQQFDYEPPSPGQDKFASSGQPLPRIKGERLNEGLYNQQSSSSSSSSDQDIRTKSQDDESRGRKMDDLPQCMLTLTPTYAVISSTISFYIPCIIMLGLYTKLFACARKHVKNIQAISKAPAPLAVQQQPTDANQDADEQLPKESVQSKPELVAPSRCVKRRRARICGRAWLKFKPRHGSNRNNKRQEEGDEGNNTQNAQAINDKLLRSASNKLTKASFNARGGATGAGHWRQADTNRQTTGHCASNSGQPIREDAGGSSQRHQQSGNSLLAGENEQQQQQQQKELQLEEENQLTQQLTLDQIEPPSANIISSGELFQEREQSRPFLAQPNETFSNQGPMRGSATLADLQRAGSWRRTAATNQEREQQQQQRLKRDQLRTTSSFNQHQHQQRGQQLATHKAAVTLGIIMGTFLFCWVPFFCLNIIKAFCVDCIPSSLFRAFTWLGYANSALNPIIYGIHNSEFRNAFNRIFFKHLNIKNSRYYLNRRFSAYDMRYNNHHNHHHHHQQQQQQHYNRQALQQQQQQHHHHHQNNSSNSNNNNNHNNNSQDHSQSNCNPSRSFTIRQLSASLDDDYRQQQPGLVAEARCTSGASSGGTPLDGARKKSDTVT